MARMSVSDRNERVGTLLDELFQAASQGDTSLDRGTERLLATLFTTTVWGFREIVLVILIARLIDPDYEASTAFYNCNPRSLYEGPIRAGLLSRGIPHRQSGPLNVAKATVGINSEWAGQRRPAAVAQAVVSLVDLIQASSPEEIRSLGAALCARLLREARRVADLAVDVREESDLIFLYDLCESLINDVPDAGNTPQRIVGLLLDSYHQAMQTGIEISGHEDRASVTSTTSKKPGDISEYLADGSPARIYEVTTKPFDQARVEASASSLRAYDEESGITTREIVVICREDDAHPEAAGDVDAVIYLGNVQYDGVTYHFVEIYEWVMAQLLRMPAETRVRFHESLNKYVAEPATSEKVKKRWQELHT